MATTPLYENYPHLEKLSDIALGLSIVEEFLKLPEEHRGAFLELLAWEHVPDGVISACSRSDDNVVCDNVYEFFRAVDSGKVLTLNFTYNQDHHALMSEKFMTYLLSHPDTLTPEQLSLLSIPECEQFFDLCQKNIQLYRTKVSFFDTCDNAARVYARYKVAKIPLIPEDRYFAFLRSSNPQEVLMSGIMVCDALRLQDDYVSRSEVRTIVQTLQEKNIVVTEEALNFVDGETFFADLSHDDYIKNIQIALGHTTKGSQYMYAPRHVGKVEDISLMDFNKPIPSLFLEQMTDDGLTVCSDMLIHALKRGWIHPSYEFLYQKAYYRHPKTSLEFVPLLRNMGVHESELGLSTMSINEFIASDLVNKQALWNRMLLNSQEVDIIKHIIGVDSNLTDDEKQTVFMSCVNNRYECIFDVITDVQRIVAQLNNQQGYAVDMQDYDLF